MLNKVVAEVTARIEERSKESRKAYMDMIEQMRKVGRYRTKLNCSNIAHAAAAMDGFTKENLITGEAPNIGIVSSYSELVSAHCPYKEYTDQIKACVEKAGGSCQFGGGVPAMCDGVTQGHPGMDLSLFSRDNIAQGVAINLSHNVFDGVLLMGICDKIAPGMFMGAASFGDLPVAFVPTGPMESGLSNKEKTETRQRYAAGEIDLIALQRMECKAYHSTGTCTFYGTANTNQLVLEAMGMMLPGSAFVPPTTELRHALNDRIAEVILDKTAMGKAPRAMCEVTTVKNFVNAVVALLASGGSTNLTMHLPAMARACGIILTWQDISDLSDVVPLLVHIYPNAQPDINAFQQAGGVPVLMKALSRRQLLHEDVVTCCGTFADQLTTPVLENGELKFVDCGETRNDKVLISGEGNFSAQGGLRVLHGNLGQSVIKISAVAPEHHHVKAPARVFNDQYDVQDAYKRGELNCDCVIVVRYAGPAAAGMPELHKLMPVLGNLQKAGYHVALLTDGRLSGASGGIPCAIHLSPEAIRGGAISLLRDGDMIDFDAAAGRIECLTDLSGRVAEVPDTESKEQSYGRWLFHSVRASVLPADQGATYLFKPLK